METTPHHSDVHSDPGRMLIWQRVYRVYSPLVAAWCDSFGVSSANTKELVGELMGSVLRRLPEYAKISARVRLVDWIWLLTRQTIKRSMRTQLLLQSRAVGTENTGHPTVPEIPLSPPECVNAQHAAILIAVDIAHAEMSPITALVFDALLVRREAPSHVSQEHRLELEQIAQAKIEALAIVHQVLEKVEYKEGMERRRGPKEKTEAAPSADLTELECRVRAALENGEAKRLVAREWESEWEAFLAEFGSDDQDNRLPLTADAIPGYRISGLLGRGGMGEVFLARHISLQRDVALKICMRSGWTTMRFEREMRLAGKLEHPNIVQTYDAGRTNQFAYIAMERIQGNTLAQLVAQYGPLDVDLVLEILRQSLAALIHIHEQGVVHRDIKPSNIMVSNQGRVKLLDLGVAAEQASEQDVRRGLTVGNHQLGTAAYSAPEQGFDRSKIGPRTDLYGLGCTAYFLLVGANPYDGETAVELYLKHRDAPIPKVADVRPEVSMEISELISNMMAKDPRDRFDAKEIIAQLAQLPRASLVGLVTDVIVPSLFDSTEHASVDLVASNRPSPTDWYGRWSLGLQWLAPILLACALIVPIAMLALSPSAAVRKQGRIAKGDSESATMVLHTLSRRQLDYLENRPELKAALRELPTDIQADNPNLQALLSLLGNLNSPEKRSALIHCGPAFIPIQTILACLWDNPDPKIRAALIQMLGVYEPGNAEQMAELELIKQRLYTPLTELYLKECEPEVHSSLRWLAFRWSWSQRWEDLLPLIQQRAMPYHGGVYKPLLAPTMVVIPGPLDAQIGSPNTETGRAASGNLDESLRAIHIPRTFAIATTEVTRWLMWRVGPRHTTSAAPEDGELPVNAVQWQEAAQFCNRMSQLEGIPESEWCYEVVQEGSRRIVREFPNALERTGYRLPTDDEWEVAVRAGTPTARPFGSDRFWVSEYAVTEVTDKTLAPVATRKPNPYGLFDTLGNISEWTTDALYAGGERNRRVRGGSVWTQFDSVRTAARFQILERMPKAHERVGFRLARTLRLAPLPLPESVSLALHRPQLSEVEAADSESRQVTMPSTDLASPTRPPDLDGIRYCQTILFGSWGTGKQPKCRLRLTNHRSESIGVEPVPVENAFYVCRPQSITTLKQREFVDLELQLQASRAGESYSELKLRFWSNKQIVNEVSLPVMASLDGAVILVDDLGRAENTNYTIDFGAMPLGAKIVRDFQLLNSGSRTTQPRVVDVTGDAYLLRNIELPLVPNGRNQFRIGLDTSRPGPIEAVVRLMATGDGQITELKLVGSVTSARSFRYPSVFRAGRWFLNPNGDGQSFQELTFGEEGDVPLCGDMNADGVDDLVTCRLQNDGNWRWKVGFREEYEDAIVDVSTFIFGKSTERPILADVDGDGRCDPGLVRADDRRDRSQETNDVTHFVVSFDTNHDLAVDVVRPVSFVGQNRLELSLASFLAGDFDGDQCDEVVVTRGLILYRDSTRIWTVNYAHKPVEQRSFGLQSHVPFIGDWNGDGIADLGVAVNNGQHLDFHLNYDDDPLVEAAICGWAKKGDWPITLAH